MISKKEQLIYNNYLYVTRSIKNKPVRLRQKFDNIPDKELVAIKKLSVFLDKYNHINYNDWFTAPYKVYSDTDFFDLSFFNTRRALKCYSIYMKRKETEDPDSAASIDRIKECISFIYTYCKTNSLSLDEYKRYIEGNLPIVLQHLKDHRLNFYMLHALNTDTIIKSVETSILNFIVEDFWTIFSQTRTKYVSSKILKEKAKKGIEIIKLKLLEKPKQ